MNTPAQEGKRTEGTFRWLLSSVFVPIICSLLASFAVMYTHNKPVALVYSKEPDLETFQVLDYFPLRKGNCWEYTYVWRSQVGSGPLQVEEKAGRFKMVVEDETVTSTASLFAMRGNPMSLGEDDRYGLLVVSNKVFYVPEEVFDRVKDSIGTEEVRPPIPLEGISIWFELPLFKGQRYGGNLDSLLSGDLSYVYVVSDRTEYTFRQDNVLSPRSVYTIRQVGIGFESAVRFVPTVGITSVTYHHHGTVDDFTVELDAVRVVPRTP